MSRASILSSLLALFLLSFSVFSQQINRPKEMTFSYVDHPTMVNNLIPLIKATYDKLGIKTHFVVQPSNRNLRLVEENSLDGDVGYMRIVLSGYHNLITIEPPVVVGIFTLLCQPTIACTKDILTDKNQTVVTTAATLVGLQQGYKQEITSQFYTINNLSLIPEFIAIKRFKYAIYPTSEKDLWRIEAPDYQYVKLFDSNLYHVLNKKYAFMADEIGQALQATLTEKTTY